jgi:hypothetical protein
MGVDGIFHDIPIRFNAMSNLRIHTYKQTDNYSPLFKQAAGSSVNTVTRLLVG